MVFVLCVWMLLCWWRVVGFLDLCCFAFLIWVGFWLLLGICLSVGLGFWLYVGLVALTWRLRLCFWLGLSGLFVGCLRCVVVW